MSTQPITEAYIFVDLPSQDQPIVAGKLQIGAGKGRFIYGQTYLSRNDAFALDPINLPLIDSTQTIHGNDGVPAVMLDAGPDNWGKKLMLALHTRHPQNKLEELLAAKGAGVGTIRVSTSRTKPKSEPEYQSLESLTTLNDNIQTLLSSGNISGDITDDLLRQLEPGSSMGGARPKSVVRDQHGTLWIAKFTRPDDIYDQSKAEQMCYLMMRDCGIDAADTELTEVAQRSVLLVKRFDIASYGRRHFISAHALQYQPRIRSSEMDSVYSYPVLADKITRIGSNPEDKKELFRRMVFNVAIGNTDDHLRNHGFIKNIDDNFYRLTKAYDVVPQVSASGQQAISLGTNGRYSSLESCKESAPYFGLSSSEATVIIDNILHVISQWSVYANQVEMSLSDRSILKGVVERFIRSS
ncbi:type II toxin-antitoxin system HipA family toxin [Neptunomonas qingdaonensis]|uniref:Serine/threonine-protein kinase HipA n=1 Tax=Neptunomonas qingdaonensis TaxID=1045558 RepID=A0A1I2NZE7_9GAMM|nr:HipA domain-containing protein [Neptunomonas qingdaonensis]SFG09204.1 serine/threonine-protein kinase HipA [Neptunomonas qingdaonensis]